LDLLLRERDRGFESLFLHRRESANFCRGGGVRRSWPNPGAGHGAVDVYLNPRKSSPTIRDPRQFELTLEDLRRRARIGRGNSHLGGIASIGGYR